MSLISGHNSWLKKKNNPEALKKQYEINKKSYEKHKERYKEKSKIYQRQYRKQMREIAQEFGNCMHCFKEKNNNNFSQCLKCRQYYNLYKKNLRNYDKNQEEAMRKTK